MKTVFIHLASLITLVTYSQDTLSWLVPYKDGKLWGLADTNGKVVIRPQFEWTDFAYDNRIRFKEKGLYGYLNEKGDVVVPAIYKKASRVTAKLNGKPIWEVTSTKDSVYSIFADGSRLDPSGTDIGPLDIERVAVGETIDLDQIEKKLNSQFRDKYDSVQLAINARDEQGFLNYYLVYKNGKVGLMDPGFTERLSPGFDGLEMYGVRFVVAQTGDKYRIIDIDNNTQYDGLLDSILYEPGSSYVLYKLNGKWGIMNLQFRPLLKAGYDNILGSWNGYGQPLFTNETYAFSNELFNSFLLVSKDRMGLYNDPLQIRIEPLFKDILAITNYHPRTFDRSSTYFTAIYVIQENGPEGFIDRTGKKRFFK